MRWLDLFGIRRTLSACAILCLGMTSFGCDENEDVYLNGSVVKNYNVSFDDVQIRLYEGELSVEYTKSGSADGTVAMRVTIDTSAAKLASGKTYDLMKYGTVSRDEGFGDLPVLDSGELTLTKYAEKNGAEVAGTFAAKLMAPSGSLQNLRGGFVAKLEIVNF